MTCKSYMKFKFLCLSGKFYRNIAMSVCLHSVYGYLCATRAELSSCDRDHMAHKALAIYYLAFDRKILSNCGSSPMILGLFVYKLIKR